MKNAFPIPGVKRWQFVAFLLTSYDIFAIHAAYFLALWGRYDFLYSQIPRAFFNTYARYITPYALFAVAVFWCFRLYNSVWRYASYDELLRSVEASILTSVVHAVAVSALFWRMPLTYFLWGMMLQLFFMLGARFSYRFFLLAARYKRREDKTGDKVMLIGAGAAGQTLLRELTRETSDEVVCFIDDNPNKWDRYIDGIPVVGGREDILASVKKYNVNKIFIAIPRLTADDKREILTICNETDCKIKQLPGLFQVALGQVSVGVMKDVSVEDLLGREPIKADMTGVFNFINGKTILVTGGGGSIGSELCRQIAQHDPKALIIFDVYENNAYDIELELREKYPNLDLHVLIGSVRDSRRLFEIFRKYRPEVVYHAAAHKHVPLMEVSPCEAIKNNAIGTYKTAYAAMIHGCKRFVLISTDKAVNPTNVMGASKRLCEMIIQSFDARIKAGKAAEIPQLFTHFAAKDSPENFPPDALRTTTTEFVAVRFGNVLGSNGSVIPVFKRQIQKGGPVTVTHPDIIRYFMTIPEAVSLVMLAGTYAKGGEIFVLDMGSPMKVDTLARSLIKQSGFRPDVDIKIEYTGLRPGEKLYEEKLMAEEGLMKTENELIHIGRPIPIDVDLFLAKLDKLMNAAYLNKPEIRDIIAEMVPTYKPASNISRAK